MLSLLFPMLWNAADNDVGVGPACSASRPDNCNGAALVGGPDTTDMDMLSKMSHSQLEAQMSKLGSGLETGVGYGSEGGRGFHQGNGWNSHGSVTCHRCDCTARALLLRVFRRLWLFRDVIC
jgi:hypothetical protein